MRGIKKEIITKYQDLNIYWDSREIPASKVKLALDKYNAVYKKDTVAMVDCAVSPEGYRAGDKVVLKDGDEELVLSVYVDNEDYEFNCPQCWALNKRTNSYCYKCGVEF